MIAKISTIYGIALGSSIITGLGGGVVLTGIGKSLAGALKLIPGLGTIVGGVIDGTVSAIITASVGHAYIAILDKMGKKALESGNIQFNIDELEQEMTSLVKKKLSNEK